MKIIPRALFTATLLLLVAVLVGQSEFGTSHHNGNLPCSINIAAQSMPSSSKPTDRYWRLAAATKRLSCGVSNGELSWRHCRGTPVASMQSLSHRTVPNSSAEQWTGQFGFGTSSGNDQSPMEIGLYCSTHRLNHSARTQRPTRSQAIYSAVG